MTQADEARILEFVGRWKPCEPLEDWQLVCPNCGLGRYKTGELHADPPRLTGDFAKVVAMECLQKNGYPLISDLYHYWMKLPQYENPLDAIFAATLFYLNKSEKEAQR